MVRLTDCPAMTIAVDLGRKATKQTNKQENFYLKVREYKQKYHSSSHRHSAELGGLSEILLCSCITLTYNKMFKLKIEFTIIFNLYL